MRMQDQDLYFRTSDFCLGSYLLAKGIEFIGINKDQYNKSTFIFAQSDLCTKFVDQFLQMQGEVEPTAFHAASKRLKQLLFLNRQ